MIDWWSVAFNALWIIGASILLASFSYHNWLARQTGQTLRDAFRMISRTAAYPGGMTLICVGWMLAQADGLWERALWIGLGLSFAWQTARAVSQNRNRRPTRRGPIAL
jgi:hypothetical protein